MGEHTTHTSTRLEDYALLSDMKTGPLVSREGSIDWLCLPRFDSPAVFSALLGEPEDGRWELRVVDGRVVDRHYERDTFVLHTTWETAEGRVVVTDVLPTDTATNSVVRRVRCERGGQRLLMIFVSGSITTVRVRGLARCRALMAVRRCCLLLDQTRCC